MTVPRIVQNVLPRFVHDYRNANVYATGVRKYYATTFDLRWQEKYFKYYEYCKSVYDGGSAPEDLRPYIESYLRDGLFTYFDDQTEALCESVYKKLEREGYVDGGVNVAEVDSSPSRGSGYPQRYAPDSHKTFPEIEQIFRGRVGDVIRGIFGCHFKIFLGFIFKSQQGKDDVPIGPQLWHSDGGPGTCLIMFFHFTPVGPKNGGTEILPWSDSVDLYRETYNDIKREWQRLLAEDDGSETDPAAARTPYRDVKCHAFAEAIDRKYRHKIVQLEHPRPGLIAAMRNNILHKGGFTRPGETRIVYMVHLYPTDRPTPFEVYRNGGTPKAASFPVDPAAI